MKLLKLTYYGLMAAAILTFASCNINEVPKFSDDDAFVAIQVSSASVAENDSILKIPVILTSLSGISGSVDFEITPDSVGGAVENVNYTVKGAKTLNFTKEEPTQYIVFNIIDNDTFGGDLKLTINLTNAVGVKIGASKKCVVTISDDEHPLAFILGTYQTAAESAFSGRGPWEWDVTIDRDPTDVNKVWISNLEPYFGQYGYVAPNYNYFYGIVNEDKTEILVPSMQRLGYDIVCLVGFTDPEAEESPIEAGNIVISIKENGQKLVLENAWGACMEDDLQSGWYNLILGPTELTKK